jgi:hypothetical protein
VVRLVNDDSFQPVWIKLGKTIGLKERLVCSDSPNMSLEGVPI